MNHTSPQEYRAVVVPKKSRTFSENMEKLRRPFLCNEICANPQNFKVNVERLSQNKSKRNLKTKQDFNGNIQSEADCSNTTDSDEETENTDSSLKNDNQQPVMSGTVEEMDKNRDGEKSFKINLNKCLAIGDLTSEIETSTISDYFTDESGNKTGYLLDSDTSIENLSLAGPLKPLKNSTFVIREETNNGNETFVYEDQCINPTVGKIKTRNLDFVEHNSLNRTSFTEPPLITVNAEKLESNILECEIANRSEHEENKKLKAKIVQLELFKQIETKDKVMSHLLELAQSPEFPKLKHICSGECDKDHEGVCKRIERPKSDAEWEEDNNGVLRYFWSSIKYPFNTVSLTTQAKVEGIVKKNPITKAYKQLLKTKKESNIKSEKHISSEKEVKPHGNKTKPLRKFHLFRNGEKFEVNVYKHEKNSKAAPEKATKATDNKLSLL